MIVDKLIKNMKVREKIMLRKLHSEKLIVAVLLIGCMALSGCGNGKKDDIDVKKDATEYVLSKETEYKWDGTVFDSEEYEYDEQGNVAKNIFYNADGTVKVYSENEYDEHKNLTKQAVYDANGVLMFSQEYENEYDEYGNITKRTWYDADGSVFDISKFENEYDKHGNLIKQTEYDEEGDVSSWVEFEYIEAVK